ncbi:MAG: methyltransferase domain-containing protein [Patescibacteria group bacterium]|jgi:ubiquinone/menaquinone biosynthesis C-methylase UbiE
MNRQRAHFQGKEASLESLLRWLRLRRIVRHIPDNSVVVDLGCGYDAGFLHTIASKLKRGIGVDLSVGPSSVQHIEMLAANLNEPLPLPDKTFDIVVSMANLEHLEKPEVALQEMKRVLKPGGKVLLTTPSTYAKPVLEFLAYRLHVVSEDEIRDHKLYFNKALLHQYFKEAGFNNIQHHYFQFGMNNFVLAVKDY